MHPQNYKLKIYQLPNTDDRDFTEFFIDPDHLAYNDGTFEWYSFLAETKKVVDWLDEQCKATGHDYNDRCDGISMFLADRETTGIIVTFSDVNKPLAALFKLTFC